MADQFLSRLSEMDALQFSILLVSLIMIFIGGKKIIGQSFVLIIWLMLSIAGTIGVTYALNPPLFENLKTQIQSSNINIDSLKDVVNENLKNK
ncbi:MAG: hypothetical protein HQM12_01395 [SAR324 cluster bacterium]|nr:hypothetical protein [SAR324 cluster bacterium]